jgi:hypothetical protein
MRGLAVLLQQQFKQVPAHSVVSPCTQSVAAESHNRFADLPMILSLLAELLLVSWLVVVADHSGVTNLNIC